MAHWIFMFRPDTYAKVQEHETVGVRQGSRKRFASIKKGDKFVVYVSRAKQLDGYGEIVSDVFEDDTLIFAEDQIYPHRVKVRFDKAGTKTEAGDALWGISTMPSPMKTTPTNMLFCKGGFMELSETDFDYLTGLIDE